MSAQDFRLGHVHIKVKDLQKSVEFYKKIFHLSVTEKVGSQFAFLSGTGVHHEIALQQKTVSQHNASNRDSVLYHIAFEVGSKTEFSNTYFRLRDMGIKPNAVDHRISWAMYFRDPDHNGLEIYVDTRTDKDGSKLWEGLTKHLLEEELLRFADS